MGKRNSSGIKFRFSSVFFILLLGFLLRILLYQKGTYELDINTFIAWSDILVEKGLSGFYKSAWSDYLPGYLYILWFLGKIRAFVMLDPILLYKLPAIIADVLAGLVIYKIVAELKNKRWGEIAAAFYVFNPAIISNSTLWGQVDSLTVLFALLAVYFVSKNIYFSSFFLAFGTAVKPQMAIASLVVLLIMIKEKLPVKKILLYIAFAVLTTILVFAPFAADTPLFKFIFERISTTLNQYPYSSVNAFSFWGISGFWKSDVQGFLSPKIVGYMLFASSAAVSTYAFLKKKINSYFFLAILFAANFMFFTRMHERHLLPVFAPLVISGVLNPMLWVVYLGYSITYVLNLYFAYGAITGKWDVFSQTQIVVVVLINIILLGLMFVSMFLKKKAKFNFKTIYERLKKLSGPKNKIFSFLVKNKKAVFLVILSFTFLTRILFLGSPKNEYFDEVYHAFTAKRMLNADPKAWEWWNTPPEGFAYEWTHPPVAKLGMVLGMSVFGENAFGWRLPGAILGSFVGLIIYLIAKYLLKDEMTAILSAFIYSVAGLPLVMSRIGMNDIYLLFFSLLSYLLFLKKKDLPSAISFGLAISSKWSVVWFVPMFLVSHIVLKRKIKLSYLWYGFIPPLVYLASYIPMFLTGHGFDIFIGVQKQMWWYHTRLNATHSYTSPWWSWPFLARPIWLYTSGRINDFISNIYAMGNPLVFWGGFISIFVSALYSFYEKNKKLGLIVFSYFALFAPWALSPRIMFLYHYLPAIPFLIISLAYVLRKYPKLAFVFSAASLFLLIYFYPHLTGIKVPTFLDSSYYWINSWR